MDYYLYGITDTGDIFRLFYYENVKKGEIIMNRAFESNGAWCTTIGKDEREQVARRTSLINYVWSLDAEDAIRLNNAYSCAVNDPNIRVYDMSEFDNRMKGSKPSEIARLIVDGEHFDYQDDMFGFDGSGHLWSCQEFNMMGYCADVDDIVDYLLDDYDDIVDCLLYLLDNDRDDEVINVIVDALTGGECHE